MPQLAPAPRKPELHVKEGTSATLFFWGMVILTGWLIFAHGCHGDEDNELFTSAAALSRLAP